MTKIFSIKREEATAQAFWFLAKEKYKVRIDRETGQGSCECLGDIFHKGGRKQRDCKHIQKARAILKAAKKL